VSSFDYSICRSELQKYQNDQTQLEPLIGLNQRILDIQESVRASLGPAPAVSAWGMDNLNAETPALGDKVPVIPGEILRQAAAKMATVFSDTAGVAFPLERILNLHQLQGDDVSSIAAELMENELDLEALAEGSGYNAETIAFFLHNLLVPFYEHAAESYFPVFINREVPWTKGVCPFCGSPARYGVIYEDKGYRKLYCGLCRSQWPYPRHKCPVCENPERPEIRQMTLGEDIAHMAEVCDTCKSYLKTTDERKLQRESVPAAEDIITANIDMAATKEGYSRAA
jgi:FdhE protein